MPLFARRRSDQKQEAVSTPPDHVSKLSGEPKRFLGIPRRHGPSRSSSRASSTDGSPPEPPDPQPRAIPTSPSVSSANNLGKVADPSQKPGTPPTSTSFWDCAYECLRNRDVKTREVLADYEKLLTEEANQSNTDSNHQTALNHIIEQVLPRTQASGKYEIAGHEFVLSDQIAQAAGFVEWAKDWIGEATKASPEASLVWAGVCLILPLLTNSKTASEANKSGFIYITARMNYYTELETLVKELDRTATASNTLVARLQTEITDLYEHILDFQIRSVLRFYRSFIKQFAHDSVSQTNWQQMADQIKELDNFVSDKLAQVNTLTSMQELGRLNKQTAESFNVMKGFLSIAEKQLAVAEDQRDIAQDHQHIAARQLEVQDQRAKQLMAEKLERCHQLFRLEAGDSDSAYEWHKNRVDDRVDGTCQWLLQHEHYKDWLTQQSGPLLVSADPGCGKSVLAKYLVDKALPRSSIILYF